MTDLTDWMVNQDERELELEQIQAIELAVMQELNNYKLVEDQI